jgi:hypothetical protein
MHLFHVCCQALSGATCHSLIGPSVGPRSCIPFLWFIAKMTSFFLVDFPLCHYVSSFVHRLDFFRVDLIKSIRYGLYVALHCNSVAQSLEQLLIPIFLVYFLYFLFSENVPDSFFFRVLFSIPFPSHNIFSLGLLIFISSIYNPIIIFLTSLSIVEYTMLGFAEFQLRSHTFISSALH